MRFFPVLSAIVLTFSLVTPSWALEVTELWRLGGFDKPESAIQDPGSGQIIVGNMAGKNPGDGYLSLVSADGSLIKARWIEGLDDPRGLAVANGRLYVADNGGFHVIDIAAGKLIETVPLEGARFPNGLAVGPDGAVYVSDMIGQTIYRHADGRTEVWLSDPALTLPNGLEVDGGRLIVASYGADLAPDFSTGQPGGILFVDLDTQAVVVAEGATAVGKLDGVALFGDTILFNDNSSGTIYALEGNHKATESANVGPGGADLNTAGDLLLVPQLSKGELVVFRITR